MQWMSEHAAFCAGFILVAIVVLVGLLALLLRRKHPHTLLSFMTTLTVAEVLIVAVVALALVMFSLNAFLLTMLINTFSIVSFIIYLRYRKKQKQIKDQ